MSEIALPSGFRYPRYMLSPMLGIMSDAFLDAVHALGLTDFLLSYFISVTGGSIPSNRILRRRFSHWMTSPSATFVPQIIGRDAETLAECALQLRNLPAKAVNLNASCPSPTVTGNHAGSFLLKDPLVLRKMVEAVRNALPPEISFSVKLRAGFDSDALLEDNIKACADGGAELIIFHWRTALEMYEDRPFAEERLNRARAVCPVPLIGNGNVRTPEQAHAMRNNGFDGVAVGRGFLFDPWILKRLTDPESVWPEPENAPRLFLEAMKQFKPHPGPLREYERTVFGAFSPTNF